MSKPPKYREVRYTRIKDRNCRNRRNRFRNRKKSREKCKNKVNAKLGEKVYENQCAEQGIGYSVDCSEGEKKQRGEISHDGH